MPLTRESLERLCERASHSAGIPSDVDSVLFYLTRWCQKKWGGTEPDDIEIEPDALPLMADKIARNLAQDGALVDLLYEGDLHAVTALHAILRGSAWRRASERANEFAEEALQKIAEVLLTGTPPSRVPERLAGGVDGPGNEYIFHSPFEFWARQVVINMIVDEERRAARLRDPAPVIRTTKKGEVLDPDVMRKACAALPGLLDAIRGLPRKQKAVMKLSLWRDDTNELLREHLLERAPDLFAGADPPTRSDTDIADRLGSTPQRIRANRSAARRKLATTDPRWALLLDMLLPHRTTKPIGGPT